LEHDRVPVGRLEELDLEVERAHMLLPVVGLINIFSTQKVSLVYLQQRAMVNLFLYRARRTGESGSAD